MDNPVRRTPAREHVHEPARGQLGRAVPARQQRDADTCARRGDQKPKITGRESRLKFDRLLLTRATCQRPSTRSGLLLLMKEGKALQIRRCRRPTYFREKLRCAHQDPLARPDLLELHIGVGVEPLANAYGAVDALLNELD